MLLNDFCIGIDTTEKIFFTEGTVWYNNLLFIFVEIRKIKSIYLRLDNLSHTLNSFFFAKIIYLLLNNLFMLSTGAFHKRRRQFGGVEGWFIWVKFIYSEKATKFWEISTLLLSYLVPVRIKMEMFQNFVAFSEYMNFRMLFFLTCFKMAIWVRSFHT